VDVGAHPACAPPPPLELQGSGQPQGATWGRAHTAL
jgi:hypothetical protein